MRLDTSVTTLNYPASVQLLDAAAAQEKEALHLSTFHDALPSLIARWLIAHCQSSTASPNAFCPCPGSPGPS
jgi:hypothetical protein